MRGIAFVPLILVIVSACGSGSAVTPPPTPPPCDEKCMDGIAVRAVRETAKLAFNLTFQGKPVGTYDLAVRCPLGGTARVTGSARSNATQGATEVKIVYTLDACGYLVKDDDAKSNYSMTFTGKLSQEGTLAVQPSATSAVLLSSMQMKMVGTVYDPPIAYDAECPLDLGQNGNRLNGVICGREVGTDL